MPMISEIVIPFIIRSPDAQTITALTPELISRERVTAALQKASARLPGSTIVPAAIIDPTGDHVDRNRSSVTFSFAVGGAIRFAEPQSMGEREAAVRLVAEVFVADGFRIHGELE